MGAFQGTMAFSEKQLEKRRRRATNLMEQLGRVLIKQNYVDQNKTAKVADESSLLKEIALRSETELLIHRNSSDVFFKPRVKSSS
jgi:hypothetical protein